MYALSKLLLTYLFLESVPYIAECARIVGACLNCYRQPPSAAHCKKADLRATIARRIKKREKTFKGLIKKVIIANRTGRFLYDFQKSGDKKGRRGRGEAHELQAN